jgi:hypothetical protein
MIPFQMQPYRERGICIYLEKLCRLASLCDFPAKIAD